ncbi:MAG: RsmB/NOP family class I SAM-dependent RNA methyltransferase, partial [Actinomycetota bacterium]
MTPASTPAALPPEFVHRTAALLGDEHDAFLAALAEPRVRGARANPAKISAHELAARLPVDTDPVPWCDDGLILRAEAGLGGHPAHLTGLFYLQEPSAMAVVEALDPQPGWRVADLAAAPGGKTTHLAARVGPEGLVVANDVSRKRLRALHDNLDLWGGSNVMTTSHSISELARLPGDGFDGVVLDAPCSGEALFRRDPAAIRHWSPGAVLGAAKRQRELLADAAALVRPGGVLVYSTCSFAREENEEQVAHLLGTDPQWTLEDCARLLSVDGGVPLPPYAMGCTARLWPHRHPGEGQFVARLRREPGDDGEGVVGVPPAAAPGRRSGRAGGRGPARAGTRRGPSEPEVLAGWDR